MDFSKNTVLKENYSFFVGSQDGFIVDGEHGLYNRDTRFLSRYVWTFPTNTQTLLSNSSRPDTLELHHATLDHHRQLVAFRRKLKISDQGLCDTLTLENPLREPKEVELLLAVTSDFVDLFEARSWASTERKVKQAHKDKSVSFSYRTLDGLDVASEVTTSLAFEVQSDQLIFKLELPPNSATTLTLNIRICNPLETGAVAPISYAAWREQFPQFVIPRYRPVFDRAVDDLRALLLFNEAGRMPAAGVPWYVTAFGRDALLTAYMLLPYAPETARGTLRYLAQFQAETVDHKRNSQPGKILHELREGELTRTGKTPHSPYYGTVDATPLFIMLLGKLYELGGDISFIKELQPHWEAALSWMTDYGDTDGDGFLEYIGMADGQALHVQSWKDSEDSMNHADGELAWGATAVSEVARLRICGVSGCLKVLPRS